jgi:hypothetical protein
MKLIDHEVKEVCRILLKSFPSPIENGLLDSAHEHDVEHAVVRDENIRRVVLHVPAGPHL